MLDIRKKAFILIGLVVGIILAILLFIIYGKDVEAPQVFIAPKTENPAASGEENTVPAAQENVAPLPEITPPESSSLNPRQLAKIFVERFGTYSNQNNNAHVVDALLLASPSMSNWLQTQGNVQDANYQGATTRVIAVSVKENGADKATATVEAEQTASTPAGEEKKQRTARVEMVLLSGVWKVDGLYWEKP